MKVPVSIICSLIFLLVSCTVFSQNVAKLFGAHANGTSKVYSAINVDTDSYTQISVLNSPVGLIPGETTFDDHNLRYFMKTGSRILIINSTSGLVTDSLTNVANFHNIEYDRFSNCLLGMELTGSSVVFKTYNVSTKIAITKSTLLSVDSISIGESTFDAANRKYFSMTNLGMIVVDSTGKLVDVLCSSPGLSGIEYDPNTNKIFYAEWKGSGFDFVAIEAITCNIGVVGNFSGVTQIMKGESTFDKTTGHYYNKTNLGILQVNTQNGQITKTLAPANNFAGIEFTRMSATGLTERNYSSEGNVFPNPSNRVFNFRNLKSGAYLEIFNADGKCFVNTFISESSISVDFEQFVKGIYFYRISLKGEEIQQGKLVLK